MNLAAGKNNTPKPNNQKLSFSALHHLLRVEKVVNHHSLDIGYPIHGLEEHIHLSGAKKSTSLHCDGSTIAIFSLMTCNLGAFYDLDIGNHN